MRFLFTKKITLCLSASLFLVSLAAQAVCDKQATKRTHNLYKNMHKVVDDSTVMFGHQDDLAYGVDWKYLDNESDVKRTVGHYPAVVGWDLGHLELDSAQNIDGVPFDKMREYIKKVYKMGGVNTISWHLHNPATGGSSWDTSGMAVRSVLPNGKNHQLYLAWIDKVADFLLSLKTDGWFGKRIPVVFRPYHEHTGGWFWWGQTHCTAEEYGTLWRMTVYRLREKGVHNALIAYSPDAFKTREEYMAYYPGDDFVDILGHDFYHRNHGPEGSAQFIDRVSKSFDIIADINKDHRKIAAMTETGLEMIPHPTWWTDVLWQALQNHKIAYVLVWRNGRPNHYYAPYPSDKSAENFKQFCKNERVCFSNKTKSLKLYRK